MLQDALLPAVRTAPWLVVTPGLCIVVTLVAFALMGEGVRAAVDVAGSAGRATASVEVEAEIIERAPAAAV
jgi:hypothetical protein